MARKEQRKTKHQKYFVSPFYVVANHTCKVYLFLKSSKTVLVQVPAAKLLYKIWAYPMPHRSDKEMKPTKHGLINIHDNKARYSKPANHKRNIACMKSSK